jgi:predicted ester cyclase
MAITDLDTLYCRYIESVINRRRLDDLDQFLAGDVVDHAAETTIGLDAMRRRLACWLEAVPDAHLVIEDLVAEGDRLMARLTATGTYRDWRVAQSTGSRAGVAVFEAWSVRNGKCVERWVHFDASDCRDSAADAASPQPELKGDS